ncbi:MAG TPA: S8 family serine peptidase [Gaiellaceae bacterium]|nr:S8 family serine peptidase [Gaiellaceae bacterium]
MGASAASTAPKAQDFLVGYDHAPTAADRSAIANAGGTIRHEFSSIDVLAVSLPSGKASSIRSQSGVKYVEDDATRTPQSLASDLQSSELVPSIDNGLYGLVTTHAVEAQAAGYTGAGVKACVADTGLDTRQSDIAPNFVAGYDAFDHSHLNDVDVFDLGVAATETHATHVSGIVLGAINGSGIHGVAPNAKLYEARVLGTQPDGSVSGETSQVMEGVQWLADQGCKVINMSLGGGDKSQAEEALYNQIRNNGTLIVVASGNDASKRASYPGRYQSVVTVGAVDSSNQLASFSNTGAQLDLVAPGVNNLSSFPQGQGRDAEVTVGSTTYSGVPAEFSSATDGVTGPFVNCGLAATAADCGATVPSGDWVAVVHRGSYSFAQKVDSAMQAGASAVLLWNNSPVPVTPTLGTPDDNGTPWLPTIIVSQADGQAIVDGLTPSTTGTLYNIAMDWNLDSGTSMATPHVTGVAALIFGKNPNLTPDQVETIMERTATDLGVPNYDTTYGWGLVNAKAALDATPAP